MLRPRYLIFVAVLAGGLLTTAFLHFHSPAQELLRAGDIFPKPPMRAIDGRNISWPSGAFLLLYMRHDSEMGLQLENYEHVRSDRHEPGIPMVSILMGTDKEVREIFRRTGSTSNTFARDNGSWRKRLGVGDVSFRLWLVDAFSQVRFATDYATPDDLRQLTEKTLTGRVEYPASQPRLLQKGDRFADFPVVDMRSNNESVFTTLAPVSIICFTSHCPACDLEEEIKDYAISEAHSSQAEPTTLLFSSQFSRADLLRTIDRYGIKSQVLQAGQNIPGLEDPLSFETFAASEIAQIDLDAGGVVKRVSYWTNRTMKVGGL